MSDIDDLLINSRAMKYPEVVTCTDKFESEETTDWDKAFNLATQLIERHYPVPTQDRYSLATHIMKKWGKETEETKGVKDEPIDGLLGD